MATSSYRRCSMCSFSTPDISHMRKHVYTIHRDDPNFHVYCEACGRSYKKLKAFRKHISRGCRLQSTSTDDASGCTDNAEHMDTDKSLENPTHSSSEPESGRGSFMDIDRQWHEARYILRLKEQCSLTQTAIDHVVSSTTTLMNTVLDSIIAGVSRDNPQQAIAKVEERISGAKTVFTGLTTAYQQRKYFVETFKLIVSQLFCCRW